MPPSLDEKPALLKINQSVYRRMFAYLWPYRWTVALAYVTTITAVLLQLFIPQLIKSAIDDGVTSGEMGTILWAAGLILLVAAVRGITGFGELFLGQWLTYRFSYDLRNDFFNAVQQLPFSFHDQYHTGDLMSRATSDVGETERFVGIGMLNLIATTLLFIGVLGAMLLENTRLALLSILPMFLLVIVAMRFGFAVRARFKALQEQMSIISKTMQESLTGINLVKAYAREAHELQKFDVENDEWFDQRVDLITVWSNNWPFMSFLVGASIFLLLWFGSPLVISGEVTIGSLFAMISYILLLNGPVQRVGFLVNEAATAGAASTRVFAIMDIENEVDDQSQAAELSDVAGGVIFEKVIFGYQPGQTILHEVSFTAVPGETVALIGPTGSGKSTITNLLPRFYDVQHGRILIDGQDIRHVTKKSLRRAIGAVLQDNFLYSNTIAANIAYGRKNATTEEVIAAAKAARAHEFIMRFPNGYETMVGERGVTLSGGQKQRVAIARALLSDPPILILDDSTSSVDTETEYLIQQALQTLMHGRTTFVIAQRLLTLKNADKILVLDQGRIVQEGTHDSLLQEEGLYREIYDLQLKDQEELQALDLDFVPTP